MTDEGDEGLERTLEAARRAAPAWNAGRQQQLKWAVMARLDQPRRRSSLFVLAFGCFAATVIGVVGWRNLAPSRPEGMPPVRAAGTRSPAAPAPSSLARLADGSSIVLDGPSAILKKTVETNDEIAFQLEAGGAHFEVAPRPTRVFRVHAGPVTVQVIGTRFHVQRQEGQQEGRSQISVDRGKVLVSWWGGSRELVAGEEGTFPPTYEAPTPPSPPSVSQRISTPPAPARRAAAVPSKVAVADAVAAPSHPSLGVESASRPSVAGTGLIQERHQERHHGVPTGPESMFLRADRARADGKPDLAIAHLRELMDRYPGDPHAPMAAFTVGRLLLESLGKPRQAALAFGQARALANGGPLGEDALAREVESLHAAGDSSTARQRADLYRQIFPNGPRLHTVMRFGGLRATP